MASGLTLVTPDEVRQFMVTLESGATLDSAYEFITQRCLHPAYSGIVVQVVKLTYGSYNGDAVGDKYPYCEDFSNIDELPEVLVGWIGAFQPVGAEERSSHALGHYVSLVDTDQSTELSVMAKDGDFYTGVIDVGCVRYRVFDGGMMPWGKPSSLDVLDTGARKWCSDRQVSLVLCGLCVTRLTDRQTDRQTDRLTNRLVNRQTDRQTDKQTDRQPDIQMDTHTDRQTDRQTYRQTTSLVIHTHLFRSPKRSWQVVAFVSRIAAPSLLCYAAYWTLSPPPSWVSTVAIIPRSGVPLVRMIMPLPPNTRTPQIKHPLFPTMVSKW